MKNSLNLSARGRSLYQYDCGKASNCSCWWEKHGPRLSYSSVFSDSQSSCLLWAGIVLLNNDHSRAGRQSHARWTDMTWSASFTLHACLKLDLRVNGQSSGVMSKAAVKEERKGEGESLYHDMQTARLKCEIIARSWVTLWLHIRSSAYSYSCGGEGARFLYASLKLGDWRLKLWWERTSQAAQLLLVVKRIMTGSYKCWLRFCHENSRFKMS